MLIDIFDANVCGREVAQGKPHPALFLVAADALGLAASDCLIVEDAPSGIQAAKAGGMAALGVARREDVGLLVEAGADLVVKTLDDVSLSALLHGRVVAVPNHRRLPRRSPGRGDRDR
jgi:beta-phosphoglucomutase-like phosphatase (HAD superfamily)